MEKQIEKGRNRERKERRERDEREVLFSLYDLRRSGSRFPLEYLARAMCGHRKFQVSPRFRMRGW